MPEDLDEVPAPEDLEDLEEDDLETLDVDAEDDDLAGDLTEADDIDDTLADDADELAETDVLAETDALAEGAETDEILTPEPAAVADRPATEEAEEEEEEEPDDEDVEASLDVILKERLVVEDEPEDEELADVDDRAEGTERVLPKQPDEFVCRSCFLVKHPSQLADDKNMLCRDCV